MARNPKEPLSGKCPICGKIFSGFFCPGCGVPYSTMRQRRPEYAFFNEFQLCSKCNTNNPYGANFCRNCGEDITLRAKDQNGYEWVDLGLSVLWSNQIKVGYYRWMDTERFNSEDLFSYWGKKRSDKDTASELFGYKWRMPTKQEVEELIELCKWEKVGVGVSMNFKITGANGNHILLIADHVRSYYNCDVLNHVVLNFWTSTTDEDHRPLAFRYIGSHFSDQLMKRNLRIGRELEFKALRIVPVADKKWKGKL